VEFLDNQGVIPGDFSSAIKQDFMRNPVKLAEFLLDMTSTSEPMGQPDNRSIIPKDPIEQWLFGS